MNVISSCSVCVRFVLTRNVKIAQMMLICHCTFVQIQLHWKPSIVLFCTIYVARHRLYFIQIWTAEAICALIIIRHRICLNVYIFFEPIWAQYKCNCECFPQSQLNSASPIKLQSCAYLVAWALSYSIQLKSIAVQAN